MPKMHLSQSGFPYGTCGTFTKNKERIQKFKETGDSKYIYQNKLNKACFQHEMAPWDFLSRITAPDEVLRPKAFDNTKSPKYDEYQRSLAANSFLIKSLQLVVL